jgi:uncharacterized protein DUF6272
MPDIYNLYKDLERDEIILSFKGDITQDLLSSVFRIMESRLEQENDQPQLKKKFYHILIECLQNLYHHNEMMPAEDVEALTDGNGSAIFMIGRGENNSFRIITGNFILNSNSEELKAKIDKVNGMTAEQLRAYYLDKLNTSELSEKGGAGLGMIDMARKSGHKIDYSFNKVSEKYSFFSLAVTVK